jgi:RNA polymerase sigma-70 factor (ECF subfamily)
LVLWRKFDIFQDHQDFRRWAFGVARYEVLAWRRDKARDRLVLSDTALEALAAQVSDDVPRLDKQRAALEHCLDKLAEQQRSLLKAAYAPEARLDQLAKESGRTIESLYKMLQRLRGRLLECVRQRTMAGEL